MAWNSLRNSLNNDVNFQKLSREKKTEFFDLLRKDKQALSEVVSGLDPNFSGMKPEEQDLVLNEIQSTYEPEEGTIGDIFTGIPGQLKGAATEVLGGGLRLLGDISGNEKLEFFGSGLTGVGQQISQENTPYFNKERSPYSYYGSAIASSLAQSAPGMVGGIAAMPVLGPVAAGAIPAMYAGGTEGLKQYGDLRNQNYDPLTATGLAISHAGSEVIGELVGNKLGTIFVPEDVVKNMSILQRFFREAGAETIGEELTEAGHAITELVSTNPDMTLGEYLERAKDTAIVSAGQGGIQSLPGMMARKALGVGAYSNQPQQLDSQERAVFEGLFEGELSPEEQAMLFGQPQQEQPQQEQLPGSRVTGLLPAPEQEQGETIQLPEGSINVPVTTQTLPVEDNVAIEPETEGPSPQSEFAPTEVIEAEFETIKEPEKLTAQGFKEALINTGRISKEQAEAVMKVIEARALRRNESADQFIGRTVKEVQKGGAGQFMDEETGKIFTAKALTGIVEDGRAVLQVFQTGDITSVMHEIGHIIRRDLSETEQKTLNELYGIGEEGWTRATEERFAREFERYLQTGKAPKTALQKVFNKIKKWFKTVYESVRNIPETENFSKETMEYFDSLFDYYEPQTDAFTLVGETKTEVDADIVTETEQQTVPDNLIEGQQRQITYRPALMDRANEQFFDYMNKRPNANPERVINDLFRNIVQKNNMDQEISRKQFHEEFKKNYVDWLSKNRKKRYTGPEITVPRERRGDYITSKIAEEMYSGKKRGVTKQYDNLGLTRGQRDKIDALEKEFGIAPDQYKELKGGKITYKQLNNKDKQEFVDRLNGILSEKKANSRKFLTWVLGQFGTNTTEFRKAIGATPQQADIPALLDKAYNNFIKGTEMENEISQDEFTEVFYQKMTKKSLKEYKKKQEQKKKQQQARMQENETQTETKEEQPTQETKAPEPEPKTTEPETETQTAQETDETLMDEERGVGREKVRKTAASAAFSKYINDKRGMNRLMGNTYVTSHREDQIQQAVDYIESVGEEKAYDRFMGKNEGTNIDVAVGVVLHDFLREQGNYDRALNVYDHLAELGTTHGRAVDLLRMVRVWNFGYVESFAERLFQRAGVVFDNEIKSKLYQLFSEQESAGLEGASGIWLREIFDNYSGKVAEGLATPDEVQKAKEKLSAYLTNLVKNKETKKPTILDTFMKSIFRKARAEYQQYSGEEKKGKVSATAIQRMVELIANKQEYADMIQSAGENLTNTLKTLAKELQQEMNPIKKQSLENKIEDVKEAIKFLKEMRSPVQNEVDTFRAIKEGIKNIRNNLLQKFAGDKQQSKKAKEAFNKLLFGDGLRKELENYVDQFTPEEYREDVKKAIFKRFDEFNADLRKKTEDKLKALADKKWETKKQNLYKYILNKDKGLTMKKLAELHSLDLLNDATMQDRILEQLNIPREVLSDFMFLMDNVFANDLISDNIRMAKSQEMMEFLSEQILKKMPNDLDTIKDMARSVQTVAILLNAKSTARNIIGNTLLRGIENINNIIAEKVIEPVIVMTVGKGKLQNKTLFYSKIKDRKSAMQIFKKEFKEFLDYEKQKNRYKPVEKQLTTTRMYFEALKNMNRLSKAKHQNILEVEKLKPSKGTVFITGPEAGKVKKGLAHFMRVAEDTLGIALGVPDRVFYQTSYLKSIGNQIEQHRAEMNLSDDAVIEVTEEMQLQAHEDALRDIYANDNFLSTALGMIRTGMNKIAPLLGDTGLKFIKAPVNLLFRGMEYTPFGLLRTAKKIYDVSKANENDLSGMQRELMKNISRVVTGTSTIAGIGFTLFTQGILTGAGSEGVEGEEEERSRFIPYAINLSALKRWMFGGFKKQTIEDGDVLIGSSIVEPAGIALAMGARTAELLEKNKDLPLAEKLILLMSAGMRQAEDQPYAYGFKKMSRSVLNAYSDKRKVDSVFIAGLVAYAGLVSQSFVPALVRQGADALDPKYRAYYSGNKVETIIKGIQARVPGLSFLLTPKKDILGKDVEKYYKKEIDMSLKGALNLFLRFGDSFLNPAYTRTARKDPFLTEVLMPLYKATDVKGVVPKSVKTYIRVNDETIKLSADDIQKWQETHAKLYLHLAHKYINKPSVQRQNINRVASNLGAIQEDVGIITKEYLFGHKIKKPSKRQRTLKRNINAYIRLMAVR